MGLNWVILQMKVYLPIYRIDECLILKEKKTRFKLKKNLLAPVYVFVQIMEIVNSKIRKLCNCEQQN